MSPEEKRKIYQKALSIKDTDDLDLIRSVSCKFFEDGGCPRVFSSQCKGCMDDDSVLNCRSFYLERIFDRPQESWTPEFDEPLPAENKVKADDVKSMGVTCDTCYVRNTCAFFKPATECSIDWSLNGVDTNDDKALVTHLIKLQSERVQRLAKFEQVDGGMVDMNLSAEMDRLSKLTNDRDSLGMIKISASAQIPANSSDSGGGILSSIFGGDKKIEGEEKKSLPEQNAEYIDIPAEEIKEPVKVERNERKGTAKRAVRRRS